MRPDQLAHLTDEERRAWEELAGFFAAGLNIVVRRLNGSRKAAPMNRHMPGAERYLSAALEALADARRERDEWRNAAESAHLRGEGAAQMRDAADLAAALGDDRDPPRWEALLAIASRRTENARAAERERDEARAELANERGEGEPPSPGWEFVTQAGGAPLWRRLVGATLFECRCCSRSVWGLTDGSVSEGGWHSIDGIDGPNAICPACATDPAALLDLHLDGYNGARVGAARPVSGVGSAYATEPTEEGDE